MKQNLRINLRASQDVLDALDANAKLLSLTRSEYLRMLAMIPIEVLMPGFDESNQSSECLEMPKVIIFDYRAFKEIRYHVRRWGYHFNQAAHALNIINYDQRMRPEDAERTIEAATEKLAIARGVQVQINERLDHLESRCVVGLR